MKEQIKGFWNRNKEDIKTGVILVLAPIAALGLIATSNMTKMFNAIDTVAEEIKEKR